MKAIQNGQLRVLTDMDNIGVPFIIEALLSDDDCKREIGRPGLQWALGEADPDSVLNADIRLASAAATDPDEHIRAATKQWFGSWKGREDKIDLSGIVEALIAEYQSSPPSETMEKIVVMLSDTARPRVTRFMRAAVHAPNPRFSGLRMSILRVLRQNPSRDGIHKPIWTRVWIVYEIRRLHSLRPVWQPAKPQ